MNKKLLIIPILVLIALVITIIYKKYKVDISISKEEISVNLYETIDLKEYLVKAIDSNGKNLTDDVKISVQCGQNDSFTDDKLYIEDNSDKIVTYYVKKWGRKFTSKLTIKVITDPFDQEFKIDYNNAKNLEINDEDQGITPIESTELNDDQKKYLEAILNS